MAANQNAHPAGTVASARRMREFEGHSIHTIANKLGLPRTTVACWLRGQGETYFLTDCVHCGDGFFAVRVGSLYCGKRCRSKAQHQREKARRLAESASCHTTRTMAAHR